MDPDLYKLYFKYFSNPTTLNSNQQKQLQLQTRHYTLINNLLFEKACQPPHRLLRVLLPHEISGILFSMHSDPLSGHFNFYSTFQRISQRFFWLQMGEDVKNYIKSCDAYQRRGRPRA